LEQQDGGSELRQGVGPLREKMAVAIDVKFEGQAVFVKPALRPRILIRRLRQIARNVWA